MIHSKCRMPILHGCVVPWLLALPSVAAAERVCQTPDCLLVDNTHSARGAVPSIGVLDTRLHLYIYVPPTTRTFVLGVHDQTDDTPAGKPSAFVLYAPNGAEAMTLDNPKSRAWSEYPVAANGGAGVWRLSVTGPEDVPKQEGERQEKAQNRFLVRTTGAVDLYLKPEPVVRVRGLRFDKPHFGGQATHRFTVQAPGVPRLRFAFLRPRTEGTTQVRLHPPAKGMTEPRWDGLQQDDRLAPEQSLSFLEVAGASLSGQWPLMITDVQGPYGFGVEQELRLFFTGTPLMPVPRRVPIATTAGGPAPARLEVTSPQTANERYVAFTDRNGRGALLLLPGVTYRVTASRGYEFEPQSVTATTESKDLRVSLRRWLNRKPGWYCGDNHAHTAYYDGTDTPAQMAEAARAEGLDWLTLTEHGHSAAIERVRKANAEAAPFSEPGKFVVVPGEEFTTPTYHANILGGTVEAPAAAPLPQVIDAAQKADSPRRPVTVQLNHPTLGKTAAGIARGVARLPLIELWNSAEPDATQLWWEMLNKGMPTFADTGSDSHNRKNAPLGYRRTYIYLGDQPLSPASIVRALREGRSFLSRGALLDVTIGGERPGGSVTATQLPVRVAVESALPMERIDIVHNGKVVHSWAAGGKREFAGARSLPAADGWYLAQVRESKNPVPLAMSNPVFVRKKQGQEAK